MKYSERAAKPATKLSAKKTDKVDYSAGKQVGVVCNFYRLTKPGIVYGNALAAIGGFLFGAGRHTHLGAFTAMLIGLCLVIAGACVFNNYLDREIDAKMSRTKKRALVQGSIGSRTALAYASLLDLAGLAILLIFTNLTATLVALAGLFLYVVVYGWAKRHTVYSTVIGSLSGSTPPVVGYTAATGHLDLAALLIFLILTAWQMPHFYAIAIFRHDDYAAAGLPIWSVVKSVKSTKHQMIIWAFLFALACACLSIFSRGGWVFGLVTGGLGAYWLYLGLRPSSLGDVKWARKMFGFSLITLLVLSAAWALNPWLP